MEDLQKRTIKSYVRRMGRMTPSQKSGMSELWPKYGIETKNIDMKILFGRVAPLTVDIGFGMGEGLLAQAQKQPEKVFIGIEVHTPGVGRVLNQLEALQINNVRVISEDAKSVLEHAFEDHSIDCVQLFFPDPWPKKKHHKRRIVQSDFIKLLAKKLKVGGTFHMATDWEDYHRHLLEVMVHETAFHAAEQENTRCSSRFEQRGMRLGHKIFDCIFQYNP